MQPYFFPYAGYFRLALASDIFILLDNVQYTRRSWITRNKFMKKTGQREWLTLPVSYGPRDETKICDVKFAPCFEWESEVKNYEIYNNISKILEIFPYFLDVRENLFEYLKKNLVDTCKNLDINTQFLNASEIHEKGDLKGENYIMQLCKILDAKEYINLAGGRTLYKEENFVKNGINLKFFNEYQGSTINILERLLAEEPQSIRAEILLNSIL
jgi:hypothetical protein